MTKFSEGKRRNGQKTPCFSTVLFVYSFSVLSLDKAEIFFFWRFFLMKDKIVNFLSLTLAVIVSFFVFTSCTKSGATKAKLESMSETQIVMSIEETDGKANAFAALKSLRDQDLLSFDYSTSQYGSYITSINGKAEVVTESTPNSSKGYSWMLYTSDMENAYESDTITIDDRVCGSSAMGASMLTVKEGKLYVWVYKEYNYTW